VCAVVLVSEPGAWLLGVVDARYLEDAGAVCSLNYQLMWRPNYSRPVWGGAVAERLEALFGEIAGAVAGVVSRAEAQADHDLRAELPRLATLGSHSCCAASAGRARGRAVRNYIAEPRDG
jgi:hypothetical protein